MSIENEIINRGRLNLMNISKRTKNRQNWSVGPESEVSAFSSTPYCPPRYSVLRTDIL